MPEGVGYGPQFTASTGLNLNYIGNHCYAYNDVAIGGSLTDVLNFKTGKGYLIVTVELNGNRSGIGQAQLQFKILLNGVTVMLNVWDQSSINQYSDDLTVTRLLIPPLTSVLVQTAQSSGADRDMQVILTGEVHGMIK